MGTRSVIKFYEEDIFLCAIYQQYDGHIEGVGKDLKDFIKSGDLVNGIMDRNNDKRIFNGVGCLVAQFIAEFKNGAGNLYITTEDDNQEYNYKVNVKDFFDVKKRRIIIECEQDDNYKEIIK